MDGKGRLQFEAIHDSMSSLASHFFYQSWQCQKHAPHPTKPGYITLLTDLTKVYFEPLAGIRVLARQREVEEKFGQSQSQRDGSSSLDLGGEEAVDEVLEEIKGLTGEMEDVEMEVKAGDLYVSPDHRSERASDAVGSWCHHEITSGELAIPHDVSHVLGEHWWSGRFVRTA
jgi:hypothetical protein